MYVTVDEMKSRQSTQGNDPIYPEMVVATGLRFMSGELERSLIFIMGVSKSSIHRMIEMFLRGVNDSPELEIKLPEVELGHCFIKIRASSLSFVELLS